MLISECETFLEIHIFSFWKRGPGYLVEVFLSIDADNDRVIEPIDTPMACKLGLGQLAQVSCDVCEFKELSPGVAPPECARDRARISNEAVEIVVAGMHVWLKNRGFIWDWWCLATRRINVSLVFALQNRMACNQSSLFEDLNRVRPITIANTDKGMPPSVLARWR